MLDTSDGTIGGMDVDTGVVGPRGPRGEDANEGSAVDRRLRGYARQRAKLDVAEAFDLVRAYELKVHLIHGCASFYEYMERALGYAPHTARERFRVARSLRALPMTTRQLATGALAYSHVRELTRVATAETEEAWLAATVDRNATQVQELVAGHEYGDLPDDPVIPDRRPRKVTLELPPEVLALWRQARVALAEERGIGEISDADLMETLCRRMLSPGTGAEGPAQSIGYEQCPDCKRMKVHGAGRMLDVTPETADRVHCDARMLGDLGAAHPARATSSVTPRMREQVFARDKFRCQVPGCRSARNLEVHHLIEQSRGGPHALWNCLLLCFLCRARHKEHYAGCVIMPGSAALPTTTKVSTRHNHRPFRKVSSASSARKRPFAA